MSIRGDIFIPVTDVFFLFILVVATYVKKTINRITLGNLGVKLKRRLIKNNNRARGSTRENSSETVAQRAGSLSKAREKRQARGVFREHWMTFR